MQTADGRRIAATRAAVVALDRTDPLPLTGPTSWSSVALHELAHVMGLTHVSDRTQLMAGVLPPVTDLQAGDRTGLARVGRSAGCVVVPQLVRTAATGSPASPATGAGGARWPAAGRPAPWSPGPR